MYGVDRLKIVMPLCYVNVIDDCVFKCNSMSGCILNMTYKQKVPEYLSVKLDYENDKAVIEFTGKILGKRYPELIRLTNIRQCVENINAMGIIIIDKDAIMSAEVLKCDLTIDTEVYDISALTRYIKNSLSNYDAYVSKPKRNGNLELEKNVDTAKCKKRLTIYDKEKEMNMSRNKKFLDKYFNGTNPFTNMCRFELNLYTMEAIRKALNIAKSTVRQVLLSARTQNPIRDFLLEALDENKTERMIPNLKAYMYDLILDDNENDIEKVYHTIKGLVAKGTKVNRTIAPIRKRLETRDYAMVLFSKDKVLNLVTSETRLSQFDVFRASSV
jgi:hypothetical protein